MSFFFFFFSSRRRHTRYIGDWSSDVCSSDLPTMETFRQLLDWLSSRKELVTVGRKVDPKHELTAVMRRMQKGPNKARSEERRVGKEGRCGGWREQGRKKEKRKEGGE